MNFNQHSELEGKHSFLSPSQSAWVNYDLDKLRDRYFATMYATATGTAVHSTAEQLIKSKIRLNKTDKHLLLMKLDEANIPRQAYDFNYIFNNLIQYVNDAIGYRMTPEQPLKYSMNCFGTADAICFDGKLLRIHDLKTGAIPAHMRQLHLYAALFCLEYKINPKDIEFETRIYQSSDIIVDNPTIEIIFPYMEQIKEFDKYLTKLKEER